MTNPNKIFKFNTKYDFETYMALLIELTYKHYFRFKKYIREFDDYIESEILKGFESNKYKEYEKLVDQFYETEDISILKRLGVAVKVVNYNKYKELEDKLNTPKHYLLNLFGDYSKNAASYKRIRKELEKSEDITGIRLEKLSQKMNENLNEVSKMRNYEHHMTDAKFIEWKEYREEQQKGNPNYERWPSNQITIVQHDSIHFVMALMNYKVFKEQSEIFSEIFQQMKMDYSRLIGESMRINKIANKKNLPLQDVEISFNGYQRHIGKKSTS